MLKDKIILTEIQILSYSGFVHILARKIGLQTKINFLFLKQNRTSLAGSATLEDTSWAWLNDNWIDRMFEKYIPILMFKLGWGPGVQKI